MRDIIIDWTSWLLMRLFCSYFLFFFFIQKYLLVVHSESLDNECLQLLCLLQWGNSILEILYLDNTLKTLSIYPLSSSSLHHAHRSSTSPPPFVLTACLIINSCSITCHEEYNQRKYLFLFFFSFYVSSLHVRIN